MFCQSQYLQSMILIILKRLANMPNLAVILKGLLIVSFMLSACIFFLLKVNYVKHLHFGLETILIERTQFGIPYVKAPSFCSAMYGWGYATAQDRLFQLAFKRLIGKGRLSKYLGQKALPVDKLFRELNFEYWANRTAQRMRKQNHIEYHYWQNYARGINDHAQFLNLLPIEFQLIGLEWQPMTVSDLFLYTKLLVWSQSQNMGEEFIRSQLLHNYTQEQILDMMPFGKKWEGFNFIPIVTDDEIAQQLPSWTHVEETPPLNPQKVQELMEIGLMSYLDGDRGSNSWVIHGNHTESGLPLIANDPHLESAIPHEWHQIRIQYVHQGKTIFWQGAAMTGTPAIVGKTPYFSLALTTIHTDSQDLYKERIEGDFYYVDGQPIKLKRRIELIEIKNEQTVEHVVEQTHRGPILSHVSYWGTLYQISPSQRISLSWTGFHDNYETWLANSHSAEIDNVEKLKHFLLNHSNRGPNMNAIYATKDNHIGYVAIGALPVRRNHQSGLFVKDGSTTENDWCGLIQGEDQLNIHDPSKGYIVTANNKPVSEKYFNGVYESSVMTARANRIDELIQEKIKQGEKFTVEDMKRIQLDTVDVLCIQNLPYILQGVPLASKYLQNFNCDFTKESYGATIYEVFFYQLFKLIRPVSNHTLNLMSSLGYQSYLFRYIRNFTQQEVGNNMNKAFENTLYNLTSFYHTAKKEKWTWEKYHTDIIIHRPFSNSEVLKTFYEKRFGGKGNSNTVNVAKMNKLSNGDFSVNHRANIRMIWSHADNESSYWIGDTGVSEKFYSRHYDDQLRLFAKDQYIEVNFAQQEQIMSGQL